MGRLWGRGRALRITKEQVRVSGVPTVFSCLPKTIATRSSCGNNSQSCILIFGMVFCGLFLTIKFLKNKAIRRKFSDLLPPQSAYQRLHSYNSWSLNRRGQNGARPFISRLFPNKYSPPTLFNLFNHGLHMEDSNSCGWKQHFRILNCGFATTEGKHFPSGIGWICICEIPVVQSKVIHAFVFNMWVCTSKPRVFLQYCG